MEPFDARLRRRQLLELSASLGGLALTSCAGQPFGPGAPSLAAGAWNNAVRSIPDVTPRALACPTSARAIVELVKEAESHKQRIRMTGSGHSFSDVAITDDVMLRPNRLDRVLGVDRSRLKADAAGNQHLVRVQSGITIRALNDQLNRLELALENLGGYDAQTIVGASMTGTHGTGLKFGPIASQIVSIQIVTAGGTMLQIEPTDGVTDKPKFPQYLEEDPSIPVRLIQDDRYFDAVSVSMGCMGIVYAIMVSTVDRFWLREKREKMSWSDLSKPGGYLRSFLDRPRDSAFPDHLEVFVNPYPLENGDHRCLLTSRERLEKQPPMTEESRTRGVLGNGDALANGWLRGRAEHILAHTLDGGTPRSLEIELSTFMDVIVDKEFVDASYRVFNIGTINEIRAYGIEMAFKLEDTIAATQSLFEHAEVERKAGRHHSVPVTLRFVKAAKALLAPQNGIDTMAMEIGVLVDARGANDLLRGYEAHFVDRFNARPHWGLDVSYLKGKAQVAKLYPRWNDWFGIYRELNSSGVFNGRLTDRLEISVTKA